MSIAGVPQMLLVDLALGEAVRRKLSRSQVILRLANTGVPVPLFVMETAHDACRERDLPVWQAAVRSTKWNILGIPCESGTFSTQETTRQVGGLA